MISSLIKKTLEITPSVTIYEIGETGRNRTHLKAIISQSHVVPVSERTRKRATALRSVVHVSPRFPLYKYIALFWLNHEFQSQKHSKKHEMQIKLSTFYT
nr:MAG TPA: hypothetical protein [Caudoviricetes sp.]